MKSLKLLGGLERTALAALILRVGLGLVFAIGGASKLSLLLDPASQAGMVAKYLGPAGYVNSFFHEFLFSKGVSPWLFLTGLSGFEFLSGLALIAGLWVRPLSLTYGFLMWTFVISLPVVTTPGVAADAKTHLSPAILVQIRDIALSGLSFVLFNLGAGPWSLDRKHFSKLAQSSQVEWDNLGVLLRVSLGFTLLVAGVFKGMDHIQSFATASWILIPAGILLLSGFQSKTVGTVVAAIFLFYMGTKLSLDKSLIGNLNGIKREFALFAGALLLARFGGGSYFRIEHLFAIRKPKGQTELAS